MSDSRDQQPYRGELRNTSEEQRAVARRLQEIDHHLSGREDLDWQSHSHLTLNRMNLSRILYYDQLYQQLIGVPGVIMEFGVQWGATLALLSNLRGIHEPYNLNRRIVGFDTFAGFPAISDQDGQSSQVGDYSVAQEHAVLLEEILGLHESASPIAHIQKYELVTGDVVTTIPAWLEDNPHAIIGMAIFDMDIYEPTKAALEAVIPRLTRGSILVFDELNTREFPGETAALNEVIGLNMIRLHHDRNQSRCAWAVWGE
ncbi:MAG TPA: crotonobetainyl-CoA--carnitine CoA-transferase [Actinobacteria bacterium]|nr:crotonobetainyl-CoA--carnitine CoA-transferase [Actinomycetota bacterium]